MKYQREFSFQLQTLKHFSFRGILNYDSHFHDNYEAIYVISGQYDLTVDEHTQTLREGDFALIFPNQVHSCRCSEKIHIWFADFSSDMISTFHRDMRGKRGKTNCFRGENTLPALLVAHHAASFAQCSEEQYLYGSCIECKYEAQALLYSIVSEFVRQVEIVSDSTNYDMLITQVAQYIAAHFCEDISLNAMAADLRYDRFYLSRMFNKIFHMNFRQYVNSCRIAYAKQLMLETKDSITSIAGECGYQSIRTFNHAFYSLNGVSPSAFRNRDIIAPDRAGVLVPVIITPDAFSVQGRSAAARSTDAPEK